MLKNPSKMPRDGISRRRFLKGSFVVAAVTATASIAGTTPAYARKVAKTAVMYQTGPKGGRKCADCQFFQAGKKACARVEGEMSAEGWCALWRKK